jgi:cytidine deaminase
LEHNKTVNDEQLLNMAGNAKNNSNAKFSDFHVGAALLSASGNVYTGCNLENYSLSLSICAERVALYKALSEGERGFIKIAVVSDDSDLCPPCGACRQVLFEFAPEIQVIMKDIDNDIKTIKIEELLPYPFKP